MTNDKIYPECRDIKCANILLEQNGTMKVGDLKFKIASLELQSVHGICCFSWSMSTLCR
jgi:hypothetical protein